MKTIQSRERVAFLGLGAMGSRMVPHLLAAGYDVSVWNRSMQVCQPLVAIGAKAAATPKEAASGAQFVLSMLSDDKAAEAVWLGEVGGAVHGLESTALAIEISTVSPQWIERLGAAVARKGCVLLDAPVAGSLPQVEQRSLVFMVGGPADGVERAGTVLATMAVAIHHVGALGQGSVMKLAVNSILAVQVAALGELLAMTNRLGMDVQRFTEVLSSMPTVGPAPLGFLRMMVAADYAPRFRLDLMAKDLGYAVDSTHAAGVDARMVRAALETFSEASASGFGSDNVHAVAKLHPLATS
jgi:3-hydroxyisobutyrate dehydrogenase